MLNTSSSLEKTTEYAFADVRKSLAKQAALEGFGIDCDDLDKPDRNPLIATVMRPVAWGNRKLQPGTMPGQYADLFSKYV